MCVVISVLAVILILFLARFSKPSEKAPPREQMRKDDDDSLMEFIIMDDLTRNLEKHDPDDPF